jgi:4-amino-4-deoxy-L-arabinose transferase-like glycosyltransferase
VGAAALTPDDDASCLSPAGRRGATAGRARLPLGLGVLGVGLAALLAPTVPLPLPLEVRWVGAFLLFVLLPGYLLVRVLLPSRSIRRLDTVLLALGAGYSVAILLGLGLHTLFRPIAPWQIAAGGGLLVVALALAAAHRNAGVLPEQSVMSRTDATGALPECSAPVPAGTMSSRLHGWLLANWPVLLVLAVAAPLRLADLGWSEFQGDEARVVLRAMAALQGADGALAAHRKVPGEILLAYLFAGSLGQIVEQVARLPYALSGVGAVLAFYSLARKLLGRPAALIAGLLLAVNGYFVAFGRILQYDSLAFFLGITGLLCCWQFGRGSGAAHDDDTAASARSGDDLTSAAPDDAALRPLTPSQAVPWAILGALLLSGAALVALGAIFLVLPALLLAWPGLTQMVRRRSWAVLIAWGWPVLPGTLAAALVFGGGSGGAAEGPSGVWSYLGPRFGGGAPYWNGADLLVSANHYLSSPYLLVMMLCGLFALVMGLISVAMAAPGRDSMARISLAIVFAALSWSNPRVALAIGAALAVALVIQAPARLLAHNLGPPLGIRVALLWAAGPLFAHLFLIRVPGTHFREAFPGLILIAVGMAVPMLAQPRLRLLVRGLFATLIIGSGHYAWVTLVQRSPEYQITYPANRHVLDWTDRDGRGLGGVFGTVHRHGWKALGVLMADGRLPGSYTTNESPAVAAWYIRQPQGCVGALDVVFRAPKTPQDRNLSVPVPLPPSYQTRGQVRVDGRVTIAVQQPPTISERIGDIRAEDHNRRFDQELASVWRPVAELYRADLGAAAARRDCPPRP